MLAPFQSWGTWFAEKPPDEEIVGSLPLWKKMLVSAVSHFNPLAGLRAAGPFGKFSNDSY